MSASASVQLHRGERATKDRLVRLWKDADIAHIAAHAYFQRGGSTGADPFVQLAPVGPEGRLTPSEIKRFPASGRPKLVVLSACSTGLANESSNPHGTHLETLASAFSAQRTDIGHTIVATLWDVEDESTSAFMSRFYRELRAGRSPRKALRAAQLWMLQGKGDADWRERFAQPYHWAPFVCVGSW